MNDAEIVRLTSELRAAQSTVARQERELVQLRATVRAERAARARQVEQLNELRRSLSWRITYPVRRLRRALARKRPA